MGAKPPRALKGPGSAAMEPLATLPHPASQGVATCIRAKDAQENRRCVCAHACARVYENTERTTTGRGLVQGKSH